jgi:Fungal rhodopsin domain
MTIDATFSNVPITIWSTVEATLAIVCACLPAIRAGIAILFPTLKTTIYNSSSFAKSQTQTTRLSKPIILVSHQVTHQVTQLDSRISGIDLEPRFVTWRILETAGLEPVSPGPGERDEEDNMSFVSFVSSFTFSRFSRRWAITRR